jgi:hypothetical protein
MNETFRGFEFGSVFFSLTPWAQSLISRTPSQVYAALQHAGLRRRAGFFVFFRRGFMKLPHRTHRVRTGLACALLVALSQTGYAYTINLGTEDAGSDVVSADETPTRWFVELAALPRRTAAA